MKAKLRCFRNDEDYDDNDEECSLKDLAGNETIQTKFGPLVEKCCEFDGYVENGECKGTDKQVF